MQPQIVGMYVLMLAGLFAVVSMIVWMFKKDGPTVLSATIVFLGFGMTGVGAFGPAFLGDYVQLVNALRNVETANDTQQQASAANEVIQQYAGGAFSDDDWDIISATLKENPVPGLDGMLERAAADAPAGRRQAIDSTRADIQRLEASLLDPGVIEPLRETTAPIADPTARDVTPLDLTKLDDRRLRLLRSKPEVLRDRKIDPGDIDRELKRRGRAS